MLGLIRINLEDSVSSFCLQVCERILGRFWKIEIALLYKINKIKRLLLTQISNDYKSNISELQQQIRSQQKLNQDFLDNLNKLTIEERIAVESEILYTSPSLEEIPDLDYVSLSKQFLTSFSKSENSQSTKNNSQQNEASLKQNKVKFVEEIESISDLLETTLGQFRNLCLYKAMLPKVDLLSSLKFNCLMEQFFNENRDSFLPFLEFGFEVLQRNCPKIYLELMVNLNMIVEYEATYNHRIIDTDTLDFLRSKVISQMVRRQEPKGY